MTPRSFVRQARVVFWKELKDSSRDRRAILAVLLGVLIGPAVIAFVVDRVADRERRAEAVRIPVVGSAHAPALVGWLRSQFGVEVTDGPADAEHSVRNGDEALVLIVPDDFADRFRAGKPAPVQVVSDGSRDDTRPEVQRVLELLQQYGAEIGALRLIARGVSPAVLTPIQIDAV